MSEDPTTTPDLAEDLRLVITAMVELTENRTREAITPLMAQITGLEAMVTEQAARIAEIEARVAKLKDDW